MNVRGSHPLLSGIFFDYSSMPGKPYSPLKTSFLASKLLAYTLLILSLLLLSSLKPLKIGHLLALLGAQR